MMKVYANIVGGVVVAIIQPAVWEDGSDIPIDERFTAEYLKDVIDITDVSPRPDQNWTYDGTTFAAPAVYQPSAEEIRTANQTQQTYLLAQASQAMTPILVSLQLGDATDAETVTAREWQAYYRALKLVDVTVVSPVWPSEPQSSELGKG